MIKAICGYCKKEFEVYPSFIKNGAGKHCSRHCSGKTHKQYQRTPELNRKMSEIMKKNQKVLAQGLANLKKIAMFRKHHSWEDIFGIDQTRKRKNSYKERFSGEKNPNAGNGIKILGEKNP